MKKIILIIIAIILPVQYAYAQSVVNQQSEKEGYSVYTLDDLYKLALERAERIKISEEDLNIAGIGKDKARSAFLPKLSAFGNYTRYTEDKVSTSGTVIQPDGSASWGVRLDQSVSLSGREITAFDISKENISKSAYDFYFVREDYLFTVSADYYDVLRAKKALDIAKANVERLTKYRDAASIRLRVGEDTRTRLLRAEAELSGAQSDEIKAKNRLDLAKAILARVVGIEGDYEIKETAGNIQKDIEPLESLKIKAMEERADIKSFELQKKIGEKQVKYAKGSYWPTLSVEGVYQRKDEDPASVAMNRESIYGSLRINFPFFEGGLRRAEVREAEAKQRQLMLAYEDRKKSVYIEVENAYLDLVTQKGIMEKFDAQVAFATDNYKATTKQFEFGIASSLDVIDANTLLVTAERQLADSKYSYHLSLLKIKSATGTLLKTALDQTK